MGMSQRSGSDHPRSSRDLDFVPKYLDAIFVLARSSCCVHEPAPSSVLQTLSSYLHFQLQNNHSGAQGADIKPTRSAI